MTRERQALRITAEAFCRAARIDASAGTEHPTRIPCPCEQSARLGRGTSNKLCHAQTLYGVEAAAAVVALKHHGLLDLSDRQEAA